MTSQFIDRIYECAIVPELWPGVLADLAKLADASGGTIFAANAIQGIVRWSASPTLHDKMAAYVAGGWYLADRRRERVVAARHAGFLTEESLFSAEELESDPTIQGFYRRHGIGRTAITMIMLPTGDGLALSVERDMARGPVESDIVRQLDDLRPHLARSALLSARLQLERARAITEALGLIGLPALVFDGHGAVLAANPMIESLTNHVHWRARDRVALKDPRADAQFRQAVATIDREAVATVGSFALRNEDGLPAAVAHVVPIRRSARDVFTRSAGILMMTPVVRPNAPPIELIQSLFDLTAAEARVARGLAAGDTVEHIATAGGVSTNTVRTQVRGVLEKTGSQRQADVIALLAGLQVPRPG
jgi:DNA-binding CsgD family transcriptional regulator